MQCLSLLSQLIFSISVLKYLELEEVQQSIHFIKARALLFFSLLYCKYIEHYLANGRHSTNNHSMNEITQSARCLALVETK